MAVWTGPLPIAFIHLPSRFSGQLFHHRANGMAAATPEPQVGTVIITYSHVFISAKHPNPRSTP
jgi:hypothetical protein